MKFQAALPVVTLLELCRSGVADFQRFPTEENTYDGTIPQDPDNRSFLNGPYNRFWIKHPSLIDSMQVISKGEKSAKLSLASNKDEWKNIIEDVTVKDESGKEFTFGNLFNNTMQTDGIVAIWNNKIIYEEYFDNQTRGTQHYMFSGTKSYAGITAALLAHNDLSFDIEKTVAHYVEHLKGTGVGDATVREVMDMTAEYEYDEVGNCNTTNFWNNFVEIGAPYYLEPGCGGLQLQWTRPQNRFRKFFADGLRIKNRTKDEMPQNTYEFLTLLEPSTSDYTHGYKFTYRSTNTDILGWIMDKHLGGIGKSVKYFEENIYSKVGMNNDALIAVDDLLVPRWYQGAAITTRDAALFGEMMLKGGINRFGERILPQEIVDDIINGGNEANLDQWSKSDMVYNPTYATFKAYRHQYWVKPNHIFSQIGVHGQRVWVDIKANLVIAIQQSWPNTSRDEEALQNRALVKLGEMLQGKKSKGKKKSKSKRSKSSKV